jgi:hypothetical protein
MGEIQGVTQAPRSFGLSTIDVQALMVKKAFFH